MENVLYKMGIFSNGVFKYSWAQKESPMDQRYKDDVLIKAFAHQQDDYCDPEDIFYIGVWFKAVDDPINDNQGHVFPSHIPLNCVLGKRTGDIIEFNLGEDPDSGEELTVRVECDQSIVPGYSPNKWLDEDPAYSQDPFVAEYCNNMYRRLELPYRIDYNEVEKERAEKQAAVSANLTKMFEAAGCKVVENETNTR